MFLACTRSAPAPRCWFPRFDQGRPGSPAHRRASCGRSARRRHAGLLEGALCAGWFESLAIRLRCERACAVACLPTLAHKRALPFFCCLQGTSVPSPIVRTNRSGGDVGTSPGINPITPYTTASLDYRASWIAGEMMQKTKVRAAAAAVPCTGARQPRSARPCALSIAEVASSLSFPFFLPFSFAAAAAAACRHCRRLPPRPPLADASPHSTPTAPRLSRCRRRASTPTSAASSGARCWAMRSVRCRTRCRSP